ncbi:MAG: ATP/GTP-binding protein [Thiothrix sp.]|uniref:GTP-binding protein n=1 Tax=Thiothrix sp. TaxID=1032 RepID=UPI0026341826|nr:ATP/GTP-binding protein [Thiothrix sp.]MDD5391520.1 ATP/GTP-binding protein [Thiothrix sp.]
MLDIGVSLSVSKYKVIFAGPVGAGKTAAVRAVTDSKHLSTDAVVSDITSLRKTTTTVAMDYGVVSLSEHEQAHIYGTPGQERFDFMWDILLKGGDALVILLDNSRNNPYRDLKHYAEAFAGFIRPGNTVIGVTHCDKPGPVSLEAYRQWASDLGVTDDVFQVDARKKDDILFLITKALQPLRSQSMPTPDQPITTVPELPATTIEETAPPANYEAEERQTLNESVIGDVNALQGVAGVSLTNAMGELLHSNIHDEALNEFIAFLSGLTPSIEEEAGMGRIRRITLKSPQAENLTVFVENGQSLGILSMPKASIPALSQQVEDILQWV